MWMIFFLAVALPVLQVQTSPPGEADLAQAVERYKARDYEQASRFLRLSLEANPSNLRTRYYMGLTLLEQGKSAEAEAELLKVADSPPRFEEVQVALAQVFIKQSKLEQAKSALNLAEAVNPNHSGIFLQRGIVQVTLKDYAAASKSLDRAIQLDPSSAYAYYYAGIAASNVKRPDLMVNYFQQFLQLAPNAPEAAKVRSILQTVR